MKYYLTVGIILATVALSGCTRTTPTDTTPIVTNTGTKSSGTTNSGTMNSGMTNSGMTNSGMSGINCRAGEILADGACVAYTGTGKNIDLFDQDMEQTVTGTTISSGSLQGYYVEPTGSGNFPGIVMIAGVVGTQG